MGIFNSLFKRKPKHIIYENGPCIIYFDNGRIWKKFKLSNGLLEGKYESHTIHGDVGLTLKFNKGKLHGECSSFSPSRNCFEYIEKFDNGVLISHQHLQIIRGESDSNTLLGKKYELGSVVIDKQVLQKKGSSIETLDLNLQIEQLRDAGVNFPLLSI